MRLSRKQVLHCILRSDMVVFLHDFVSVIIFIMYSTHVLLSCTVVATRNYCTFYTKFLVESRIGMRVGLEAQFR